MMNVMIVTNSRYLKPAVVMLYSLFLQEQGEVSVYLPYEDLTQEELEGLCRFVESFPGKRLIPLYVGTSFKEEVASRNGILVETYYRIIGWGMLPEEVEKILYLDVDIVIQKPLQTLYGTDMGDKLFAVCEDIFGKINGFHEGNKRRLSIPAEGNYFNAGVMLVNVRGLRETGEVEKILKRVYAHYERYEYNDQDVLNEMYQDRLIYVGWDQYNCPPAWYYLNRQSAAQGILEFASYSQIHDFQKAPEQFAADYLNLTEQIAGGAAIIHHLADTKPWKEDRREGGVYEYFDRCYYALELDALRAYEQTAGQKAGEPSTPVLFYYGVRYCYNILNDILGQFELALRGRGVRTLSYDEQEEGVNGLTRFMGKRFRAVVGIQSYLFSVFLKDSGMFLHDKIYAPKFNFVLDHPIWLKNQLSQMPKDCFVLTHDVHYQDFIEAFYPDAPGSVLFPPAANEKSLCNRPVSERVYDAVFIGTYGNYRDKCAQILECRPRVRHLAAAYLLTMKKRPDLTAEDAFYETLQGRGVTVAKEEFLELFFQMKPVIQAIMYYYREKTVRTLLEAGVPLEIWGESWQSSPLAGHPLLAIHPDVTPEESFSILGNSKLSLNIMAWHKGGFTERLANSMYAGAVVVTDRTTYEDGMLCEGENIVMFDLKELEKLPEKVRGLLRNTAKLERIAENGRRYARSAHSWDERAEEFLYLLDEIG